MDYQIAFYRSIRILLQIADKFHKKVMLKALARKLCRLADRRSILNKKVLPSLHCGHNYTAFSTSHIMADNRFLSDRLKGTDKNVWVELTKMAVDYKACNLGQGFPDMMPPKHIRDAVVKASGSDNLFMHQYTRSFGHPRLVNALAKIFGGMMNREIDPLNEVLISVGGYGSLFSAVQGLVNPGDECIIIEPYFDCYEPMTKVAGGTPVFVPLRLQKTGPNLSSGDFKLDPEELASKFNEKTKLLFFNTPNNPLGKVYTLEEMKMIADLCKKHDVIVISDEVYEWMAYKPNTHIKIATLPGMWDRTITIGSAGKTFSVTGWKLGWSVGPPHLMKALQTVHQNSIYTCPTILQEAVGEGLEVEISRLGKPESYFEQLTQELSGKKERMAAALRDLGMTPIMPQGGYFMMADYSNLDFPQESETDETKDYKFVKWACKNKGLAIIPVSAFYNQEHRRLSENYVRFCFIKDDKTLERAFEIMKEWKKSL